MKNIAARFGLGGSLAAMFLLEGTPGGVAAGWLAAALLARSLVREDTAYKDMFVNALFCHGAGMFWVWSMLARLSGLNSLGVSMFYLLFVAAHALYLPAMLWLYRALPRALDRLALRAAVACVSIDWLPLKLFPWRIGHSQWSFTAFIQMADFGGVLLITFIMVWVCEAVYRGFGEHRRTPAVLAFVLLLSAVSYGVVRMQQFSGSTGKELLVSVVQASAPNGEAGPDGTRLLKTLESLTEGIHASPDLVVWPETSLPFVMHESVFERRNEPRLPAFSHRINLLSGGKTYRRPNRRFNSAVLIRADGRIPLPYNKRLPIPFGEYIPYEASLPFLKHVHPSAGRIDRGTELRIFDIPLPGAKGTARIAPFICYEEVFPALGIEAVQKDANLLVALSDDSWSGSSGTILRQHFVLSAFRSVELRRSLVRTTGTGISAIISPAGRTIAALPPNQDGVLTAPVPIEESRTFYALLGGDLVWRLLAHLAFIAGGLAALVRIGALWPPAAGFLDSFPRLRYYLRPK